MGSGGKIAAIFILSLFLSSFFVSYFAVGFNVSKDVKVIDLSTLQINLLNTNINFKDSSQCDLSKYKLVGIWNCSANGLTSLNSAELRYKLDKVPDKGVFKNSYSLTSNGGDYYIIVTEGVGSYLHVKVSNDGIHIPNDVTVLGVNLGEFGDTAFIPLDNANIGYTDISTEYNTVTNLLTIIFNDKTYAITGSNLPVIFGNSLNCIQGFSFSEGGTVYSMSSNYAPQQSTLDSLNLVWDLLYQMLLLVVYSFPYDVIPLIWQVLLIFPQEFLIGVGIAMFIREG